MQLFFFFFFVVVVVIIMSSCRGTRMLEAGGADRLRAMTDSSTEQIVMHVCILRRFLLPRRRRSRRRRSCTSLIASDLSILHSWFIVASLEEE
jgi:hypothetical protein